jgi:hypothetical protein
MAKVNTVIEYAAGVLKKKRPISDENRAQNSNLGPGNHTLSKIIISQKGIFVKQQSH